MRGSFVSAMLLLAGLVAASSLEQATNDNDDIEEVLSNATLAVQEPEQKHD